MKSNYEALGKHIRLVDYRNSEQVSNNVLGISIDKEFMPSVANVIGADLSRYKLISNYYRQTIFAMLSGIGKSAQEITTEDLRRYLTDYQMRRKSSKVTIDNIRRILSSYFSWMEDEDHIVKSPVRRIHKVKTAKVIKETYSDETLEIMRDNCSSIRNLAMIDLLHPLECVSEK